MEAGRKKRRMEGKKEGRRERERRKKEIKLVTESETITKDTIFLHDCFLIRLRVYVSFIIRLGMQ